MSWRFAFLLRQRLKESLWVVPFLGAVLGPLLGLLTNWLDHTVRVPGRGSTRPPPPPGYPDETTALDAMDEAERLSGELIIQPDAIAAIVRNKQGKIRVTTNRHPVGRGATWGMLWGTLFGMLFFVPFLGMAVGAGLAALMGKVEKTGIDKQFQRQVRDMLQPGTSALFLVVEKVTPDKAVEAPNKFGGAVLKSSLSKEAEQELQQEYEEDQRFADTDQAPPAPASPPPAATGTGIADELERLKGLLDQGALTPAEFDAAKQKVLGQFSGKVLEELRRLWDHDIVRLVDLLFVTKDADGRAVRQQRAHLGLPGGQQADGERPAELRDVGPPEFGKAGQHQRRDSGEAPSRRHHRTDPLRCVAFGEAHSADGQPATQRDQRCLGSEHRAEAERGQRRQRDASR